MASDALIKSLVKSAIESNSSLMVLSLSDTFFSEEDLIKISVEANKELSDLSSNYFSLVVAKDKEQLEELEKSKQKLNLSDDYIKIIHRRKTVNHRAENTLVEGKKLLVTFLKTISSDGSEKVFAPLLDSDGGLSSQSIINFETISDVISESIKHDKKIDIKADKLAKSLKYLRKVYKHSDNVSIGSLDISTQWWKHLDVSLEKLFNSGYKINKSIEIETIHFSILGMPSPKNQEEYENINKPKRYQDVIKKHWGDQNLISESLDDLETKNNESSSLAKVSFADLNYEKAKTDFFYSNTVLSLCDHNNPDWLESWNTLKEEDFFNPTTKIEKKKLTIKKNGSELCASEIDKEVRYLPIDKASDDLSQDLWILKNITLECNKNLIDLELKSSEKKVKIIKVKESQGKIDINIEIKDYKKFFSSSKKPITIEVYGLDQTDIKYTYSRKVIIANPCFPTIAISEDDKTPYYQNHWDFTYSDPDFEYEDEKEFPIDIKNNNKEISIEIFDNDKFIKDDNSIVLEKIEWDKKEKISWGKKYFQDDSELEIKSGNRSIKFLFRLSESNLSINPFSSIHAKKPVLETLEHQKEYDNDVRNHIEEYYLKSLNEKKFGIPVDEKNGFGQIILSNSKEYKIEFDENINLEHNKGLTWCKRGEHKPYKSPLENIKTPQDTLFNNEDYREELKEFEEAFYSLEFNKLESIPSRSILSNHIGNLDKKISRYLEAYTKLIQKTKDKKDDKAFFWACYPFSVFILDSIGANTGHENVTGVMLSPLHPIRLAWYFACQTAIKDSVSGGNTSNESLLSIIDGFDLPFISPDREQVDSSVFIATPISFGYEDVFISWSYLRSNTHSMQDSIPQHIGGYRFPAASTTGLASHAIKNSIKDYLNTYPHIQSLNINIDTKTKYRDRDIDKEIISILNDKSKENKKDQIIGVMNVDDSEDRAINQIHEHEKLSSDLNKNSKLNWQYHSRKEKSKKTYDIKFMQDNNTNISFKKDMETYGGSIPKLPIRRFFTRTYNNEKTSSYLNPVKDISDDGWKEFNSALNAIETSIDKKPYSIVNSLAVYDDFERTEWVILGDYLLDPVATNMSLAEDEEREDRILWDWKPPNFYQKKGNKRDLFAKRPYVTISKIDSNLINNFKTNIKKTTPDDLNQEEIIEKFRKLMQQLGLKGIGLSSLLNQDLNKASGALGFFYTYKLIDQWTKENGSEDCIISVLPLDSVDSYLKSFLGGKKSFSEAAKRADLLMIKINKNKNDGVFHIKLLPVEIKSYGINSQDKKYKKPPEEAIEQLKDTLKNLTLLKEELNNSSNNSLKDTSLASLIETSLILSGQEHSEFIRNTMENCANGNYKICSKSGLVLYFVNEAVTVGHETPVEIYKADSSTKVLFADPFHFHEALWNDTEDTINDQFSKIIQLCLEDIEEECAIEAIKKTNIEKSDDDITQQEQVIVEDNNDLSGSKEETEESNLESINKNGVEIIIGKDMDSHKDLIWYPSLTEKTTHMNMGVTGDLGSGKTQLLKSIMYQTSKQTKNNRGHNIKFLILDYKKDYTDDFIKKMDGKVIQPKNIPLNIFSTDTKEQSTDKKENAIIKGRILYTFLSELFKNIGPVQEEKLLDAVEAAYSNNEKDPTINDVFKEYKSKLKKPDGVSSKLRNMVDLSIFSNNKDDLMSFGDFFDQTCVIDLSPFATDKKMQVLVVTIILQLYYDYMIGIKKPGFIKNESNETMRQIDSLVLVDEASTLMKGNFGFLEDLLTKGREFGVGVILSSQYFSHFKKKEIEFLENLSTWNIMLDKNINKKDLVSIGVSQSFDTYSQKINKLEVHELLHVSRNGTAFVQNKPFYQIIKDEEE
jgi:hypothetical protein